MRSNKNNLLEQGTMLNENKMLERKYAASYRCPYNGPKEMAKTRASSSGKMSHLYLISLPSIMDK